MLQVLVGGAMAFVGVLVGGWMQRGATRQVFAEQVREERRRIYHQHIASLVADVREKCDESYVVFLAFGKMTSFHDLNEWIETDTGREGRVREARIRRTLVELGFLVGETKLRGHLHDLQRMLSDWGEKGAGLITAYPAKGQQAPFDVVMKALEYVSDTRKALNAVQTEAQALLAVPMTVSPGPSPWRRALSWFTRWRR